MLEADGWTVAPVEYWQGVPGRRCDACGAYNRPRGGRRDAFGFGDLLAMHPEHGIALVQVTSGANAAARCRKIERECRQNALAWMRAGGCIMVIGWRKLKVGRRRLWRPRILTAQHKGGAITWQETP